MSKLIKKIFWMMTFLGFFDWLPDIPFLKLNFRLYLGYKLNLKNPRTFNEKLQWLKLYDFKSHYTQYADKYAVRNFIAKVIGEQYLKPIIAIYNSTKEINWDDLPDKFVLKCTSGSGYNVICTDKSKFNRPKAIRKLNRALKRKHFYLSREYPYKNIQAKIICEQFIFPDNSNPNDYKVFCFNGQAKLLEFHVNINNKNMHTCDYYNRNLDKLDFTWNTVPSTVELPNQKLVKKIIDLSEKIAKDLCFLRVDWYIVGSQIYFGEITFYNWGGLRKFNTYADDLLLGSWLKLPDKVVKIND